MAQPIAMPTARGERTSRAILDAAEALFAAHGYAETRLDDVATAVGIRRASIVYHFRDKQALYDAVLEEVVGALEQRIAAAFASRGSTAQRIEAAVSAWVDFGLERPTFGRLLLREVANADPSRRAPPLAAHLHSFIQLVRRFDDERAAHGEAFANAIEPHHFASAIAGATLLHGAAIPALLSPDAAAPTPAAIEGYRSAVLSIARRLLGVPDELEPTHCSDAQRRAANDAASKEYA